MYKATTASSSAAFHAPRHSAAGSSSAAQVPRSTRNPKRLLIVMISVRAMKWAAAVASTAPNSPSRGSSGEIQRHVDRQAGDQGHAHPARAFGAPEILCATMARPNQVQ